MVLVQLTVTTVTLYYFYKVLRTAKKDEEINIDSDES